ncbi:hypothetical protein CPB85DRAFT_1323337 [Mucidula mucida]|nr:hypothetical protein CPB85DRAFT_1323337 [Mucidula mucida]
MTSRDRNGPFFLPFFEERSLQLLAVLMSISNRWVSVDLRRLVPSCAKALDAVSGKLSRLEALHLDCGEALEEDIHAFDDTPCLRTLSIGNAPMEVLYTRSLVALITPLAFLSIDMLSECPRLQRLSAFFISPSSNYDRRRRLTMESITHLSLTNDNDSLMCLDLPNLLELELAEAGDQCELTVTSLLEHSRCPLRKLSLPLYRGDIPTLVKILRRIPNIEEVVIEFYDSTWEEGYDTEYIGLRVASELLKDFICVMNTSPARLTQFRMSFMILEPLEVYRLHYTFREQNRVQDFLLEGDTLSFKGGF